MTDEEKPCAIGKWSMGPWRRILQEHPAWNHGELQLPHASESIMGVEMSGRSWHVWSVCRRLVFAGMPIAPWSKWGNSRAQETRHGVLDMNAP